MGLQVIAADIVLKPLQRDIIEVIGNDDGIVSGFFIKPDNFSIGEFSAAGKPRSMDVQLDFHIMIFCFVDYEKHFTKYITVKAALQISGNENPAETADFAVSYLKTAGIKSIFISEIDEII